MTQINISSPICLAGSDWDDFGIPRRFVIHIPLTDPRFQRVDDLLKNVALDLCWLMQTILDLGMMEGINERNLTEQIMVMIYMRSNRFGIPAADLSRLSESSDLVNEVCIDIYRRFNVLIQGLVAESKHIGNRVNFDRPFYHGINSVLVTVNLEHGDDCGPNDITPTCAQGDSTI